MFRGKFFAWKYEVFLSRGSHPEVFCKKTVLKKFTKLTGIQPCWFIFLIKFDFIEDFEKFYRFYGRVVNT